MKVLCNIVAIYASAGVALTVAMLAWWACDRYAGAYRRRLEAMPALWKVLLFSALCWPLVVYDMVAEIADRVARPRG